MKGLKFIQIIYKLIFVKVVMFLFFVMVLEVDAQDTNILHEFYNAKYEPKKV